MKIIAPVVLAILIVGGLLFYLSFNKSNILTSKLPTENLEISSQEVEYFSNTKGYLAKPVNPGNYPGVIMIHEWWGLNQNIKNKAEELAREGYIVLAVDLFGSVATTPEEARKQVNSLNQELAIKNMQSGINFLQNQKVTKIGSLGWCFGGAQSLQISLKQDLEATVIYYGNLVEEKEQLKKLQSPVLGIFGDQDAQIPVTKVTEFEKSLKELSIDNQIFIYEGVGHAFANPSGQNFAPEQTKDAWNKTLQFLERNLK